MRALLFSAFIKPERAISEWGWLPLIIGLSVAEALTELTGKEFLTKWPNDVLYEDKKVCGILCQSNYGGVIAGIGINVNFEKSELPVKNASAINLITGSEAERELVLAATLRKISENLRIWGESGVNSLADIYLKYSDTIGKEVRVELGSGNTISAIAVGLSEFGELKLSNGSTVSIGDVTHLR